NTTEESVTAMRVRIVLRALLAVATLVPAAVLFNQAWHSASDKISFGSEERDGVRYLGALVPLSTALAQADAAASAGQAPPTDALSRAVDAVATVDLQVGDGLRSRERWSDLRAKIQALPRGGTDVAALDGAYGTVGDLLLALYTKVETTSNLILDPVAASYFLQAVAAVELPGALVQTGHLVDLATVAAATPTTGANDLVNLADTRAAALAHTTAALGDLTSAQESSTSPTLGSALLGVVDRFQLAVQTLTTLT